MRVVESLAELRQLRHALILDAVATAAAASRRPLVGFVPTMGALHAGHEALLLRMAAECDVCIASIFVNPLQFGPNEDLDKYPRTFESDCAMCEAAGVDLLWFPSAAEMYPQGYQTTLKAGDLASRWCGARRPGHFDGVATVVAKLFGQTGPDRAYFGEKDFQQLQVVKRLAADLDLQVEIIPCPTVREADGLAMSSRNKYLSAEARALAPRLHEALLEMRSEFVNGEREPYSLIAKGASHLRAWETGDFELEYLAVVDPDTLQARSKEVARRDRILIAARVGAARLIDNEEL